MQYAGVIVKAICDKSVNIMEENKMNILGWALQYTLLSTRFRQY